MEIALGSNQQVTRDLAGRFVFVMAADGPIQVYGVFDDRSEEGIELEPRTQGRWERRFIALRIVNLHSAPQTVTLKVADAQYFPPQEGGAVMIAGQAAPLDVEVNNTVSVSIGAPVEVTNSGGFGVVALPGASITTPPEIVPDTTGATIAANPGRLYALLKVDPNNTGLIWLSTAAGTGIPLEAGDPPLRLDTDAAIDLVAANATDKIYVMEVLE